MIPHLPADILAPAVAFIRDGLAARTEPLTSNVRVATKRTNAKRQVVVAYTGGNVIADVRSTAGLSISAIAETDEAAYDLARVVSGIITTWPGTKPVVRVNTISLPYPSAEPSGMPEWSVQVEVVTRGQSV